MTDTHDTNLPEKPVELEEDKKTAEVSEPATTETPAEVTLTDKPAESVQKLTKEEILNKLKAIAADVECCQIGDRRFETGFLQTT